MLTSNNPSRSGPALASGLLRNDLCAQLAPLNRYGLAGVSAALVDGVIALVRTRWGPNREEARNRD